MFYNRIYFTSRNMWHRLKVQPIYHRKLITSNGNNGNGSPKDYIATALFICAIYYVTHRR